MTLVLTFMVLFLLTFSVSEIFNTQFIESLPFSVSFIVLSLYLSGFINGMNIAANILIVFPFILFVAVVIIKKFRFNLSFSNISGMLVFALLFAYFWYIDRASLIYEYDEFSHWALVVKNMFLYNNFGNIEPTTATFLTYPPAQGLFEYFFLKICRSYSESRMILATNIFIVAFALPAFKKAKNIFSIGIGSVLCLSALFYINNGVYRSTYVDVLLGIIWGYVVIACFEDKKDLFSIITLSLSIAVLTLAKASGFGLAAGTLLVFILRTFIVNIKTKKVISNDLKFISMPVISMLIFKFLWSAYINHYNLEEKFEFSSVTADSVLALFNGTAPEYRYETISNFAEAFFRSEIFTINLAVTPVMVILVPFVILLAIYLLNKNKSALSSGIALLTVCSVYIFGLLFSYLFSFSEYEAVHLASFGRYITTVAAGACIVLSYYIQTVLSFLKPKVAVPVLIILCILIRPAISDNIKYYNDMNTWANSFRGVYDWENELVEKHCPADSAILYMAPGSSDLVRLQAQYTFTPVSIVYPYNFSPDGEKYYDESYAPDAYSADALREHLIQKCDYVFLHKALPEFVEDYKQLFCTDLIIEGLYKVDKTNGTLTVVELLK